MQALHHPEGAARLQVVETGLDLLLCLRASQLAGLGPFELAILVALQPAPQLT
jgi:hypothetical protein